MITEVFIYNTKYNKVIQLAHQYGSGDSLRVKGQYKKLHSFIKAYTDIIMNEEGIQEPIATREYMLADPENNLKEIAEDYNVLQVLLSMIGGTIALAIASVLFYWFSLRALNHASVRPGESQR